MIAHAERRRLKDGSTAWYAVYLAPTGKRTTEPAETKRKAEALAHKRANEIERGEFVETSMRGITFATYVERYYWPSARHLEPTTRAAYRSYLDKHFLPRLGAMPLRRIVPSVVQAWVNDAVAPADPDTKPLSARSVVKYHTFLHSVFKQAAVDQAILTNPCAHTKLPKVVKKPKKAITPEQFDELLAQLDKAGGDAGHVLMVLVAIETGLRWGELIALRPSDFDFVTNTLTVQRVIMEVSKKATGSDRRMIERDYPKDNEQREVLVSADLCRQIKEHMLAHGIRRDDLLFANKAGNAISRNTFRSRVWRPAVGAAGIEVPGSGRSVRFHDLRGAHASWLLAGGADLKVVMDRLGHRQITTTQQYLGSLPDAGDKALAAFQSVRGRGR